MNILWHSNSAETPSGYGNQTKIFTPKIKADGHGVVISAFFGREGHASLNSDGILTLPRGANGWCNDVIEGHLRHPHWNEGKESGDAVISLVDPLVCDPSTWSKFPWAAWSPIDSMPIFEGNITSLKAARWVWSMSKFGHDQLEAAGFNPTYIPHGIDTKNYAPGDRAKHRAELAKYLGVDLDNRFLIVTVAANKGTPSRKNFVGQIEAFALFVNGNEKLGLKPHPDALYYIHTEPRGVWQGEDIRTIAAAFGVADKVLLPNQYHVLCGLHSIKFMNSVYNAGDIFLNTGSEGFGIPTVEAQSAGCPVIVSNYASSPELCFAGKMTFVSRRYMPVSAVFWGEPIVPELAKDLGWAYEQKGNELLRQKARAGALPYDADTVYEKYMHPAIQRIERELQRDKDSLTITERAPRKRIITIPMPVSKPDVSVLVPVYNAETYGVDNVRKMVDSALNQDGVNMQVVLVNNASTDSTPNLVCNWAEKDGRIKVINRALNNGSMEACNDAAGIATGRYFILATCRSWFEPSAFKEMVQALDGDSSLGFVYGATEYHGAKEYLHTPPPFNARDFYTAFPSLQAYLYRREAWDKGCRYVTDCKIDGQWVYPGDWDYAMQLIVKMDWKGLALKRTVYHYRLDHSGQQTHIFEAHRAEIMQKFNEKWAVTA